MPNIIDHHNLIETALTIISKFGGQTALAKLIGKRQSNIEQWSKFGIPAKWQPVLLNIAKANDIDLKPEDFFIDTQRKEQIDTIRDTEQIPFATHFGEVQIGSMVLPAYVLNTGQSVFSLRSIVLNLFDSNGGNLERYIGIKSLKPFLFKESRSGQNDPMLELIRFDTGSQGISKYAQGFPVEKFMKLCVAYSRLADTEQATDKQRQIGLKAREFINACAKVGILALVDEVTGYQYEREENALQLKLKLFLNEEMREWEKTFPEDLWLEFGRLTKWTGSVYQRSKYWGKLVNELIYGYLDKDVLEWLKTNTPKPIGNQQYNKWLNSQYGLKKLNEHIWMTVGIAVTCDDIKELQKVMAERFGGQ